MLRNFVLYAGLLASSKCAETDAVIVRDWYSWHMTCHRHNQTMLSWPMWMDRGRPDLNISYPVWLYGFEVQIHVGENTSARNRRTFNFSHLETHNKARTRCMKGKSYVENGSFTLKAAKNECIANKAKLPTVSPIDMKQFQVAPDIIDIPFWIQPLNVSKFARAHCYLLDQDLKLKKSNCSEKYSAVCVHESVHDVMTYIGQESRTAFYKASLSFTLSSPSEESTQRNQDTNDDFSVAPGGPNNTLFFAGNNTILSSGSNGYTQTEKIIIIALISVGVLTAIASVLSITIFCKLKSMPKPNRKAEVSDDNWNTPDIFGDKKCNMYENCGHSSGIYYNVEEQFVAKSPQPSKND
ncbi:uncharacterized protein LOC127860743 isoform X2 [Dreissena polymorpha]|nr:uncharacterized protein LOC127860743 isoform X2 [Dreissena polymorpha]